MPRIPRRWDRADAAPSPEEQHTTDPASAGTDAVTDAPGADPEATVESTAVQPTVDAGAVTADAAREATVESAAAQPTVDAGAAAADAATSEAAAAGAEEAAPADATPRFRERARMRRRLRYLRRVRELSFRDLGGLVFDLQRFGRDRGDLVSHKLESLAAVDRELRALETALDERRELTELREAGIAACPRCGTLHDTDANFCPGCGTSLRSAVVRNASPVVVSPVDDASPQQQPTATTTSP